MVTPRRDLLNITKPRRADEIQRRLRTVREELIGLPQAYQFALRYLSRAVLSRTPVVTGRLARSFRISQGIVVQFVAPYATYVNVNSRNSSRGFFTRGIRDALNQVFTSGNAQVRLRVVNWPDYKDGKRAYVQLELQTIRGTITQRPRRVNRPQVHIG